jgi:hypothetical protein
MKKLKARLISADDKTVSFVEVDDLQRKTGQDYARRMVVLRGKKFVEPESNALDFVGQDEWHEVVEVPGA